MAFFKKMHFVLSMHSFFYLGASASWRRRGANLHPIQTIYILYLRLTEAECNITMVNEKVQEQPKSEKNIIISDSECVQITDSAETAGNL